MNEKENGLYEDTDGNKKLSLSLDEAVELQTMQDKVNKVLIERGLKPVKMMYYKSEEQVNLFLKNCKGSKDEPTSD